MGMDHTSKALYLSYYSDKPPQALSHITVTNSDQEQSHITAVIHKDKIISQKSYTIIQNQAALACSFKRIYEIIVIPNMAW